MSLVLDENEKRVLRNALYNDDHTSNERRLEAGTDKAANTNTQTEATVAAAANQAFQRILQRTGDGPEADSTTSVRSDQKMSARRA